MTIHFRYNVLVIVYILFFTALYSKERNEFLRSVQIVEKNNTPTMLLTVDRALLFTTGNKIQTEGDTISTVFYVALPAGYKLGYATNDIRYTRHYHIENELWYRGIRCVKVNITNTDDYNNTQTIDISIPLTIDKKEIKISAPDHQFDDMKKLMIVNYSSDQSNNFTTLQWNDSTGNWIDYNHYYIKLAIIEDGIYRLTYNDLVSIHPSVSLINPKTLKLYKKGQQLPLYVFGEEDEIFNNGDYIEFPATRNYSGQNYRTIPLPSEEYPQYMNRYTDTSYFFLTWGGDYGKRFLTNEGTPASNDTLRWYTELIHLEKDNWLLFIGNDDVVNQHPKWQLNDMWSWSFLSAGGSTTFSFTVSDLYPAIEGKAFVRFANFGASSTSLHKIWFNCNNSQTLDSLYIGRFQHGLLESKIPSQYLKEGQNSLRLYSQSLSSGWNTIATDWAELEYPRKLIVKNDGLIFSFPYLQTVIVGTIELKSFSSDEIKIYKNGKYPKRISQIEKEGTSSVTVTFTDTVDSGDMYFAFTEEKVKKPKICYVKNFENLRANVDQADYLLITAPVFLQRANEYCQFVRTVTGLKTKLINVSDIFDEFGYGYPTPESIREFVKSTSQWQLPMPSYLCLLGDGTYDFKYVLAGNDTTTWVPNHIPAYGYPVSDPYYSVLDENEPVPQLYVGRIPAKNLEDFEVYFNTYRQYVQQKNDIWNKTFLMFSGGNPNSSTEIEQLKATNQSIINHIITQPPLCGQASHFYKTVTPQTNFGPYTVREVQDKIDQGAVIINYIGHSGTQTWDNGITSIHQLKNKKGRYPLICDFGCSTAKFAESNIQCFGELFLTSSETPAIGYIGNSALGFLNFAQTVPTIFFETLIRDTVHTIGKAHLLSKLKRIQTGGGTNVLINQVLLYTNILLGDPALRIALPTLPNFQLEPNSVVISPSLPTDAEQFATITIPIINSGTVINDSLDLNVRSNYGSSVSEYTIRRRLPLLYDTVTLKYPVYERPGSHSLSLLLNPDKKIQELDYNDNSVSKSFSVLSTAFQLLKPLSEYKTITNEVLLLNPTFLSDSDAVVVFDLDTIASFATPQRFEKKAGIVTTGFPVYLHPDKRYYWRAKIKDLEMQWTEGSFYTGFDTSFIWQPNDSWIKKTTLYNLRVNQNNEIILDTAYTTLSVIAASFYEGSYGNVKFNGEEVLPNTFWWGHSVVIIDTIDFLPVSVQQFKISESSGSEANRLAQFLEDLPYNTLILQIVSTDGAQGLTERIKAAVRMFGSRYIDSLRYRDSWIMLGRKGAPVGTAREILHRGIPNVNNPSVFDTVVAKVYKQGRLITNKIGPVSKWLELYVEKETDDVDSVLTTIMFYDSNGKADTLIKNSKDTLYNLSGIKSNILKYIQIENLINKNSNNINSPYLRNISLKIVPPSELAVSPLSVRIQNDSLIEGEILKVVLTSYNVGYSNVDSFDVKATVLTNRGIIPIDIFKINNLKPLLSYELPLSISTQGLAGTNTIIFEIDPYNMITELFKSNNIVNKNFYVRRDTIAPVFDVTFDGKRILNGDYVLSNPTIRIEINDNSPMLIDDPSLIFVNLNGRRVQFSQSTADSIFIPQTTTSPAVLIYKPSLQRGSYNLEVRAMDVTGNWSDSVARKIYFRVDPDNKLLDVFNYPNPFTKNTYFTFNLVGSAMPEEVVIKIFTISGKRIKTMHFRRYDLQPGFNRIYWDGKDDDGDEIANGVYLYKVTMKNSNSIYETIQKLVKVQ